MELLRSHLSRIFIPEPTDRIYKHECCISFETPRTKGGLFVDLSSFFAFGEGYVLWNYEKTGNPVYLRIVQTKKPVPEYRPLKKPTLLAIGVGGVDNHEPDEYEETYSICILPEYISLPFPSVHLPYKVMLAVNAILLAEGVERKEQTAEKKQVSAFAMNLQQINNGVTVPPAGWKCCKCDKTEDLWLNLTDGMILCGRKNWDGTGGNNHTIEHYEQTKYPLAVKLGTITADLEGADVFSYPEDGSVEDPLLAQHLAFFGIDFSSLHKTDMTTAERELDQNTNFDWNRIQESGHEVGLLFGPGYTGLANLGNSCYMASIMQVVFSTRPFISRYYGGQSLKSAFMTALVDPTMDLNVQTKLGHGLLSGKYSQPAQENGETKTYSKTTSGLDRLKPEGIQPRMFKRVIAVSHPEFSSMRQQDALEFFLHLLDEVKRVNLGIPGLDPSWNFKFFIEERLQCPSGKVAYNKRSDYILSLNIPLHEATNKEQVEAFNKLKAQKKWKGKEVANDEIVRPRVPLEACLRSFSGPEELHDFHSTALNAKTTAIKTAGLTNFPDYLVLHMRKFVMEEGWVPKKLDVYIDVPYVIDISHMRSTGIQPGEQLLPEKVADDAQPEPVKVFPSEDIDISHMRSTGIQPGEQLLPEKVADDAQPEPVNVFPSEDIDVSHMRSTGIQPGEQLLPEKVADDAQPEPVKVFPSEDIVSTLSGMGFNYLHCQKAAINTSNTGVEEATTWLLSHMNDSDIDDPITSESQTAKLSHADEAGVETLLSFGFQEARKALEASGGNVKAASDWILSRPEASYSMDTDGTSNNTHADDSGFSDGSGNIDDPITSESQTAKLSHADEASVETLLSFGFQEEEARKALEASGGNVMAASDWLLSQPEASYSMDTDGTSNNTQADDSGFSDGSGRYALLALVSHMGTSTHCGHYVAHVFKNGRWVIFNDSKVVESIDLPKNMGYLYFFERISS